MEISREKVLEILGIIQEADLKKDIVSQNLVEQLTIGENNIETTVFITNPALHARKKCKSKLIFNCAKILVLTFN